MTDTDFEQQLREEEGDFEARTANIPDTLGSAAAVPGSAPAEEGQIPGSGLTVESIEETLFQAMKMMAEAIEGGKFWALQREEARTLAEVWHPILAPLWQKWMADTNGALVPALIVTGMSLVPRAFQEVSRQASWRASTATAKSGASPGFSVQPEVENPLRPIA